MDLAFLTSLHLPKIVRRPSECSLKPHNSLVRVSFQALKTLSATFSKNYPASSASKCSGELVPQVPKGTGSGAGSALITGKTELDLQSLA
jgi:hypothetical protein